MVERRWLSDLERLERAMPELDFDDALRLPPEALEATLCLRGCMTLVPGELGQLCGAVNWLLAQIDDRETEQPTTVVVAPGDSRWRSRALACPR
ncbi:hypothetical protein MRX96_016144 [Rhipicephalus microplus]